MHKPLTALTAAVALVGFAGGALACGAGMKSASTPTVTAQADEVVLPQTPRPTRDEE